MVLICFLHSICHKAIPNYVKVIVVDSITPTLSENIMVAKTCFQADDIDGSKSRRQREDQR
jgi:hypothetical protein